MNGIHRHWSPKGYTLIELMVTLAISASLLALVSKLMHQSMRLSSVTKQHERLALSFRQFGDDFRRNIQHATKIEKVDSHQWKLVLDSQRVVSYQIHGRFVECLVRSGEKIVKRDRLKLDHPFQGTLEQFEDPPRLQLAIRRTDVFDEDVLPVESHVRAVVGTRVVPLNKSPPEETR